MDWALQLVAQGGVKIGGIFTDCAEVLHAIEDQEGQSNWRISTIINNIKRLLSQEEDIQVELIPMEWNIISDKAAAEGRNSPQLSLFHLRGERPQWLMNICTIFGLSF